ncbi:antibiotic biosynthesis monooxygenase family protein [Aquabacterium sp. OR-4]|uniref:antibiotic biosynthesis monooxygenase family protein n=1 Tax=Aquabacterium sp. OR-4 TaxID=2978127 RepID=UPI0021B18A80|nr:antibiotic biosynthesis monooxygenase family protein [Aquabacterium sp. OR-4]MDT7838634.1 antibiotic biosynthesis monooxygenase family protein [Aquabacterium sp. OR-4]
MSLSLRAIAATSIVVALLHAVPSSAQPPASEGVVLINTFEVLPGRETECLAVWDRAAAFLSQRPGFVSTRLHRALRPDARLQLINVAQWASPAAFQAAVGDPAFRKLSETEACSGSPALYGVVRSL